MAQDTQPNRPLSGSELRQIMVKDVDSILQQDGMLASHVAYKDVSYEVTVKVRVSNPMQPVWINTTTSKDSTLQQIAADESMAAVNAFPHKSEDAEETFDIGVSKIREIISPNVSRVENGLPVTISHRTPDGEMKEHPVTYEVDDVEMDDAYRDRVTERELTPAEFESKVV